VKSRIKRIVSEYTAKYVEPFNRQMYPNDQVTYYPEQESTYTDLSQLDTVHSPNTFEELNKFVYPGDYWTNVDWGGGNFSAPYTNEIYQEFFRTPTDNETLYGSDMIFDLSNKQSNSIDNFLSPNREIIKISSSMDLTDFMKVSEDTLIHKSKKDLWRIFQDKNGETFISRLFDEDVVKD
jgi:hypothetical protein